MRVGISFDFHRIVERSAMNSLQTSEKLQPGQYKTQGPQISDSIMWQDNLRDIRVVTDLQLIDFTGGSELDGI